MIARVESLGAENLEAQEHYSRHNNSNFFVYYYGPVSLQILVKWIPSHVITIIRMLAFFLAGLVKISITTAYLAFVFFFTRFRFLVNVSSKGTTNEYTYKRQYNYSQHVHKL